MLQSLSIRNVVLIDTLDAAFESGLCALTGETGAGKSILLGALGLALGERADRAQVRTGAREARATAEFALPGGHAVETILADAGIDVEPDEPVVLRRRLSEDGRSRVHVNDQAASVGLLRQLGEVLVEIHGQHDGRGLMDQKTHLGYLDAYADHADLLTAGRDAWKAVSAAQQRLDDLITSNNATESEQDYLRHALGELDTLDPHEGEEEALADERQFLMGAERALGDLQSAQDALRGDGGGLENRLNNALRGLDRVREQIGEGGEAGTALERASSAIDRALIEFEEASEALADAGHAFDVEPGRLEAVEERLFALRGAARKHAVPVSELNALRNRFSDQLQAIDDAGELIAEAEKALKSARTVYDAAARALTQSRLEAGQRLEQQVAEELAPLKMDKARVRVSVIDEPERSGARGWDKVVFEVSTNPGSPFGALDKIASGGELSRFGLALKVVLAGREQGLVMVFDEVDQGVGGAVADAVGRRLKRLSRHGQTLVVTHSPQVAAVADHHWKIEKSDNADGGVRTTLRLLTGDERREEVARMLSGADITDAARAQADALMAVEA